MKYIDTGKGSSQSLSAASSVKPSLIDDQAGKVGYLVAWLLGVPVWILLLVFLIRGH